MIGNFVFDIDGTLTVAGDDEAESTKNSIIEKFGEAFLEKHRLSPIKFPHYIFPGYYALFRWLHEQGGRLYFFSSGMEERNAPFAQLMMRMAFSEAESSIPYQVFSRHHCIDTHGIPQEEKEKYQSYIYGQRKKKLAGIVVPEASLVHTLLIDDDITYLTKNEEYNFVGLNYCYQYQPYRGKVSWDSFSQFHSAYYLAGLFDKMFEAMKEKNFTLVQAAKYVQFDLEGQEISEHFRYPSLKRPEYYHRGRDILAQIDPSLDFFHEMPVPRQ